MNGLDILIIGVFFASAIIGAMRGFTKELLSLFSWGGSVTIAYFFLPFGRGFVQPYIANPMMADGAALFCIFIISLIMLSIIANIIAGYIHESSFRGLDHSLGFGFGLLRGVVVLSAAELFFSTFSPRHAQSPTIQSARFTPMLRKGGDTLLHILPMSIRTLILEQALKVENQVNAKVREELKHSTSQAFSEGVSSGVLGSVLPGVNPGNPQGAGAQGNPNGPAFIPQQSQQAPMQQAPMQQGPMQQGPMQQGPMQQGPMQQAPMQQAPMQQAPMQQAPMQQAPMQQAPMMDGRPPQPGQATQLAPPINTTNGNHVNSPTQGADAMSIPQPGGLGQSAMPQDTQSLVGNLATLNPKSTPSKREDGDYTRGQRDDMNRLFQSADGE